MRKIFNIIILLLIILNIIILFNLVRENNTKYEVNNKYSITILGNKEIDVNINGEYEELGATYTINDKTYDSLTLNNINTKKNGKYVVKYYPENNSLNSYNSYRLVNVIDKEAPVIILNGASKINMYIGDKYNELGYTVKDNSNEDLNQNVVISGEVDPKKEGIYKIVYEVSDSSGNKARVTRVINVIKKEIPKTNVEKRKITTSDSTEKGSNSKTQIDLNKNENTVTSMNFNDSGISITGYIKNGNGNYIVKLCKEGDCTKFSTKSNGKKYSSKLNLSKLENGTYNLVLEYNNNDNKVIDELSEEERIVRAKIGNKLVTVLYDKTTPSIKIENFKYVYDILIDVGHGGDDGGSRNSLIKEKTLNLTQSLYEKKRFEEHGLNVLITRTDDSYGIQMGSSSLPQLRRKALAVGYYGVVSKIVYGNHHNSIEDTKYSGYELILTNMGTKEDFKTEYKIADEWKKVYQLRDTHLRIYGRHYDTDELLSKENGQIYNIKDFYALQRIPYELFNIYTVTYEGCYLSNLDDYKWYINNWKNLSEIKIKYYVESLGVKYKEPNL